MNVQLDLRKCHGTDYRGGKEPAAEPARPSSMTRITFCRGTAVAGPVILAGTFVVAGCLLLSACGAASPSGTAASNQAVAGARHGGPGYEPAGAPLNGSAATSPATQQSAKLAPASQDIIYTAGLTLRSANAMVTARRAIAIVTAAGGYTSSEHAVAGRSGGSVSLQLKVPVPAYAGVLAQLSSPALGMQIALTQQATDVTEQVADVTSLVSSQQAAITALQGLLRRAGSISDLLQVQQQISTDESALESLQAQQRALDRETSYATITMTLLTPAHRAPVHKHPASHGFVAGLTAGWRALRHALGWLATALGAALPFLVALAIVAGIGYAGRRRFARRGAGPTAAG
jgi:Domain of unknown function (DUF4349)